MTPQDIGIKLKEFTEGKDVQFDMSSFSVRSIENGDRNFSLNNLLAYCDYGGIQMSITDLNTEESWDVYSVFEIHKVLKLLMDRYNVDNKLVYRKTAMHYTPPKSFEGEDMNDRFRFALSIKTLLAVCEVIHCKLDFRLKTDEKQC